MSDLCDLVLLWEGTEYNSVEFRTEFDSYHPEYVDTYVVSLKAAEADYGNPPHHADWVEWTWNFHGSSFEDAATDAYEFALALDALALAALALTETGPVTA